MVGALQWWNGDVAVFDPTNTNDCLRLRALGLAPESHNRLRTLYSKY
jgi:hypothetical protein